MGRVIEDQTQATTNAWATIATTQFYQEFRYLVFHLINRNVYGNDIRYRVQASNVSDFTGVVTLEDAAGNNYWTVTAGNTDYQTLSDPWYYVRVQIVADAPPAAESVRCIISGT